MDKTRSLEEFESRIVRGVVGGVFAGLIFLLATMAFATSQDLPAVAPMLDISTIFNLTDKPEVTPENISVGLVTHLTLSAVFGVAFALVVPLLRGALAMTIGAAAFGVALYVVNFQILGRLFFEWFQEGPNQLFELFIHIVYGLLLLPFFASAFASREAAAERRSARAATPAPTAT